MEKREIGEKIRRLREKENITQNALANRAGVSPTYIYQLEQGLKSPTVEYLGYICAGLNISLAEFFAEEQSEKNVAGRTTDALNEKQKRLLDEFLSSL
ncbi:MAG: helix-turn-helix domain-containing protein [Christensenellaceae bacterium]